MNIPVKNHNSPYAGSEHNFLAGLLAAIMCTAGFKKVAGSLVSELLHTWAGTNRLKKILIWPVDKLVRKIFTIRDPDISGTPVKDYLVTADAGQIGTVLTAALRYLNTVHQDNPLYLTEKFRPAIGAVIANTDFGELKEMLDNSADDFTALAGAVNEELWLFPAKMVCLLSLIPTSLNIVIGSLVNTIRPMNNIAPDLLADVVVSLIREIDGRKVGGLVNEVNEVVRKIHTGSALIGEKGNHAFPAEISGLISAIMKSMDIPLLLKSRTMLGEINDIMRSSFINILEENPEYAVDFFQGHFRSLTAAVRSWSMKADAFERLFADEDVAREFSHGMAVLDAQDMADTVNRLCSLFNKVRLLTPGTIKNFLTQFFGAIDASIASETAQWLADDVVRSLKPLAPEIMPPLINGIADLLAPEGTVSPEMKRACLNLKRSFNLMEGDHDK